MGTDTIGCNAGLIWRLLNERRQKMSYEDLVNASGIAERELCMAIGWLARENKIFISMECGGEYFSIFQEVYC